MKLSIIVPFYDEEKNILPVLNEYRLFSSEYNFELIAVNNGSTDNSQRIFDEVMALGKYPFLKVVIVPKNIGYGYGIMTGLRSAVGEVLAWTHADFQTDAGDVFRAFDKFVKIDNKKIVIKGRRVRRSFTQAGFSLGMAIVASVILRKVFFEINAQPKLFHRNFLKYLEGAPNDFSLDLYWYLQAKNNNYRIETIDVIFRKRLYGQSKWAFSFASKWKTIIRTIKYIWRLHYDF